jgi:HTH-type transcriptional regulator/antitoxin HigA
MTAALSQYQALLVEFVPRPIRSEREYRKSLRQIERLMTANPTREMGELIDLLATLIEQYEAADHPTPKLPPRQLLDHYLENRGLTRAELARQTGIPRSAITNILKGRRSISKANARRLAEFFRVPISAFIGAE